MKLFEMVDTEYQDVLMVLLKSRQQEFKGDGQNVVPFSAINSQMAAKGGYPSIDKSWMDKFKSLKDPEGNVIESTTDEAVVLTPAISSNQSPAGSTEPLPPGQSPDIDSMAHSVVQNKLGK